MTHRIYRNDMTQQQRDKIAAANTGKKLSQSTRNKIARSMADYWAHLPYKPGTEDSGATTPPTTQLGD